MSGFDDPLTQALMRESSSSAKARHPGDKLLDEMEAHERGLLPGSGLTSSRRKKETTLEKSASASRVLEDESPSPSSEKRGRAKNGRVGASESSRRDRKAWRRRLTLTSVPRTMSGSSASDDSSPSTPQSSTIISPLHALAEYVFEDETGRYTLDGLERTVSGEGVDSGDKKRRLLFGDSHTLQMQAMFVLPAMNKAEFETRYSTESRLLVEGRLSVTNYMLYFEPIDECVSLLTRGRAARHLTIPLAEITRISADLKKSVPFNSLCAISRRRAHELTSTELAAAASAARSQKRSKTQRISSMVTSSATDSLALLSKGSAIAKAKAKGALKSSKVVSSKLTTIPDSTSTRAASPGIDTSSPFSSVTHTKSAPVGSGSASKLAAKSRTPMSPGTVVSTTSGDAVSITFVTRRYRTMKFVIEEMTAERVSQVIRMLKILCFPRDLKHTFAFQYAARHPVRKIIRDYDEAKQETARQKAAVKAKGKCHRKSRSEASLGTCFGPKIKVVAATKMKKKRKKAVAVTATTTKAPGKRKDGSSVAKPEAATDGKESMAAEEFDAVWAELHSSEEEEVLDLRTGDKLAAGALDNPLDIRDYGRSGPRKRTVPLTRESESKSKGKGKAPDLLTTGTIEAEDCDVCSDVIATTPVPPGIGDYDIWGWNTFAAVQEYRRIGILDDHLDESDGVGLADLSTELLLASKKPGVMEESVSSASLLFAGSGRYSRRTPPPSPPPPAASSGSARGGSMVPPVTTSTKTKAKKKRAGDKRMKSATADSRPRDGGSRRMPDYSMEGEKHKYRMSLVNKDYAICGTYPWLVVVPRAMTDAQLIQVSKFRRLGRLPVLTWKRKAPSNVALFRCSQPKVGLMSSRSYADELLIKCIINANMASSDTLYVMDARPKLNAQFNRVTRGAGVESADVYDNVVVEFLDIANIHVMRKARKSLASMVYKAYKYKESEWMKNLCETDWLLHIRFILKGTLAIVKVMTGLYTGALGKASSVLCHCSDGWDRTSQLCCLVQLCMDPYFRTLRGFAVLIEKDWLSFGHQFAQRCGFTKDDSLESDDERSPVFEQFIDCVWQLTQQFPTAFEFNSEFLIEVMDHLYSLRFGTFMCDTEFEREHKYSLRHNTLSLWTYLQNCPKSTLFYNPFYDANAATVNQMHQLLGIDGSEEGILFPHFSSKLIQFWNAYYLRHSAEHMRLRSADALYDDKRQTKLEESYRQLQVKLISCQRELAALKSTTTHSLTRQATTLIETGFD